MTSVARSSETPRRRLLARRERPRAGSTYGAAALRKVRRRRRQRRLVDAWSLPELFVLRGLVHLAVFRTRLSTADGPSGSAGGHEDYVTDLLTRTRRVHFRRGVDERLSVPRRSALVRLFPLLAVAGRQAQRRALLLFDRDASGGIAFSSLCETLARCRLRPRATRANVRQQAGVVYEWFREKRSARSLTAADVELMVATAQELAARSQQRLTTDLPTVAARVLGRQQTVGRDEFCGVMSAEFPDVVQLLLSPFDIVGPALHEHAMLLDVGNTQWAEGDTGYVVAASWWQQWVAYAKTQSRVRVSASGKKPKRLHLQVEPLREPGNQSDGGAEDGESLLPSLGYAPRPGPVDNTPICESQDGVMSLRAEIAEQTDFVVVSLSVWQRLMLIYGGGPALPRRVCSVTSLDAEEVPDDRDEGGTESAEEPPTSAETRNPSEDSDTAGLHTMQRIRHQRVQVELYPLALDIRLARHDSRRVHLLFSRRFLVERSTTVRELVHRLGVFPGVNAHEISLWVRREKFKPWRRIETSLDSSSSRSTLEDMGFCDSHEVLLDFRPIDVDDDPVSDDQQQRKNAIAALPAAPFAISVLQTFGNDFISNESAQHQFSKTGNWNAFRDETIDDGPGHHRRRRRGKDDEKPKSRRSGLALKFLPSFDKQLDVKLRKESRLTVYDGVRATGLLNMGNTCFMNCALQCIGHSPVFREYFLSYRFEDDVNKRNPLGSRGLVTAAYARLAHSLWHERELSYYVPNRFRDEFIKFRRHFQETRQYDAHEFMVSLLDSLHEDLNRARPGTSSSFESTGCFGYLDALLGADRSEDASALVDSDDEADDDQTSDMSIGDASWHAHTSLNESVVVDLFHGQMRSVTVCGTCGERKVTFDPSLFFSLPIPESKFVRIEVKVVLQVRMKPDEQPDSSGRLGYVRAGTNALVSAFWLQRGSVVADLCARIAAKNGHSAGNRFILVEVRRNRIKRVIDGDELVENIAGYSSLFAYERAWTLDEIPSVVPALISECLTDDAHSEKRGSQSKTVTSFDKLVVGSRVDALGVREDWHSGTVVEVVQNRVLTSAGPSNAGHRDLVRAVNCKQVCVHFDAFSGKWNKWYSPSDWAEERIVPLHTRTTRVSEVFEVQVVHRFVSNRVSLACNSSPGRVRMPAKSGMKKSLFQMPTREPPTVIQDHHYQSFEVFGMPLFVTVASDKTSREMHRAILLQVSRFLRDFDSSTMFACANGADHHATTDESDTHDECSKSWADRLPYVVRIVNLEDVGSVGGTELPNDDTELLQHFSTRSVLTLDWKDYKRYGGQDEQQPDDYDDKMSAQEMPNANSNAVPLAKCMDALLKQEAITLDDHWVCEKCGVLRAGVRNFDIWRLPDLVMIQLKRFQYLENQHKQKVRALVDFPLESLDFSRWIATDPSRASTSSSSAPSTSPAASEPHMYDLYAVANHVGGLARGHYTASCRYDGDFAESSGLFTGSPDGDVQMQNLWLRFDDEKVTEIAAGDVVTDAAYVLFYKRRTLSPSNVLRYAL